MLQCLLRRQAITLVHNAPPPPDEALSVPEAGATGAAEGADAAGAEAEPLLSQSPGNLDPLPNVNRLDLSNIFDEPFAEQVFRADIGPWQGPFLSNRGQHWLQVKSRTESVLPSLREIPLADGRHAC